MNVKLWKLKNDFLDNIIYINMPIFQKIDIASKFSCDRNSFIRISFIKSLFLDLYPLISFTDDTTCSNSDKLRTGYSSFFINENIFYFKIQIKSAKKIMV